MILVLLYTFIQTEHQEKGLNISQWKLDPRQVLIGFGTLLLTNMFCCRRTILLDQEFVNPIILQFGKFFCLAQSIIDQSLQKLGEIHE